MSYHVYYRGELGITPALTEADAAIATRFLAGEKNEIFDRATQAGETTEKLWPLEMLVLWHGRDTLFPVEDESRHGVDLWLRLLQVYFLADKGYRLNGQIAWDGDEPSDRGTVFVKDGASKSCATSSSTLDRVGNATAMRARSLPWPPGPCSTRPTIPAARPTSRSWTLLCWRPCEVCCRRPEP